MAHAAVDHLRVARCRAIAPAVIRCAKKGATLDDPARDRELGLRTVVAGVYRRAARIVPHAARAFGVQLMPGAEPIGGPFPDITGHIAKSVAVWREDGNRRGSLEPV